MVVGGGGGEASSAPELLGQVQAAPGQQHPTSLRQSTATLPDNSLPPSRTNHCHPPGAAVKPLTTPRCGLSRSLSRSRSRSVVLACVLRVVVLLVAMERSASALLGCHSPPHTVVLVLRTPRLQGILRENQVVGRCIYNVNDTAHKVKTFGTPHIICALRTKTTVQITGKLLYKSRGTCTGRASIRVLY